MMFNIKNGRHIHTFHGGHCTLCPMVRIITLGTGVAQSFREYYNGIVDIATGAIQS